MDCIFFSKSLALAIRKEYQPSQTIAIYRHYETGASITFFTGKQVHIVDGQDADLWFGSLFPDVPPVFQNQNSFVHLWNGPNRLYLFTEDSFVDDALKGIDPKTVHVLARSGGKVVFTNQPSAANSNAPSSPSSQ